MEIFTGVYEIKVPNHKEKDGKKAAVNEIHTDTIRLRSNGSNEEETATVTLRAPNRYVQCMYQMYYHHMRGLRYGLNKNLWDKMWLKN